MHHASCHRKNLSNLTRPSSQSGEHPTKRHQNVCDNSKCAHDVPNPPFTFPMASWLRVQCITSHYYKILTSPRSSLQQIFRCATSHAVSTRSSRNLCGGLCVRGSPNAQEAFYDQGCARTGKPILDFWYVLRWSTRTLSPPSPRGSMALTAKTPRTPLVSHNRGRWRSGEEVP